MNKSKFKTVKFKPIDRYLFHQEDNSWKDANYLFTVSFTEKFIKDYPELFEVELAERVFEHGAWYKAQYYKGQPYEIVKFHNGKFKRNGLLDGYPPLAFEEIGDKVL